MIISIKKQQGLGIKIALSFSLLLLIRIDSANAQKKDTVLLRQLAPVTVTATRLEINEKRLPAALTVLSGGRIQIGQPQLSMFESLGGVAGLFAQNPDNYTQDLRISIRGFGARAAFGIRGLPQAAPFDGIILAAAGLGIPDPLLDQLAIGGRLVAPVAKSEEEQQLVVVERVSSQRYQRTVLEEVFFVPLQSGTV